MPPSTASTILLSLRAPICHIPTSTIIRIRISRLLNNDQAWKRRDQRRWTQQQPGIESSWNDGASLEPLKTTCRKKQAAETSNHLCNILKHLVSLKDLELVLMVSSTRPRLHRYLPSEDMVLLISRIPVLALCTRQCSHIMRATWITAPCLVTTACLQQFAWSMSKSEAS